jgi:hypothetical protein
MLPIHAHKFSQPFLRPMFVILCALFFVLVPLQRAYAAYDAAAQSAPDPLNPHPCSPRMSPRAQPPAAWLLTFPAAAAAM